MQKTEELGKATVAARQSQLKELELKFEQSVKMMEDAESAKKDMARTNTATARLMPTFTDSPSMVPTLAGASRYSTDSLAAVAALISPSVLQENNRILSQQMALHSLGGAPSMSSFDSLPSLAFSRGRTASGVAGTGIPMFGSATLLDRMIAEHQQQQQYNALLSEALTRRARTEAQVAQILAAQGTTTHPPSPAGRMALKRPPQLPSLQPLTSNKRTKLA